MNSPRYLPAGLLIEHDGRRLVIDGGAELVPGRSPEAWLVTDEHAELIALLRRRARAAGAPIGVADVQWDDVTIVHHPVAHTSHPTFGYLIAGAGRVAGWAPEFWQFPDWAGGLDLLFAEAAGWRSPIRFRGGVGGHAAALTVADEARRRGVRRLVFAHIGRPTIRAIDAGERPPFGEFGQDGQRFTLTAPAAAQP
jgi:hypothetical protein